MMTISASPRTVTANPLGRIRHAKQSQGVAVIHVKQPRKQKKRDADENRDACSVI